MAKSKKRKKSGTDPPGDPFEDDADTASLRSMQSATSGDAEKDKEKDKYLEFRVPDYTRSYPESGGNFEYIVFIESQSQVPIGDRDMMSLATNFKRYNNGVKQLIRMNRHKVGVIFERPTFANAAIINKKFNDNFKLKASVLASATEITGIIQHVPIDLSNEQIYSAISSSKNIITVKRFMRRTVSGTKVTIEPTKTVSITFSCVSLPDSVDLNSWRFEVRPYIPPVKQCLQCLRNPIERTASKRWRGSVRRIAAACVYNLSCFAYGCSAGWVSGVLGNEALTGGAWLAALPCLVALPAAPFFAVLADARGRKAGGLCICISFIACWLLAAWCGPKGVWASRVAAGVGGAGALALAPIYCTEIAPNTRGLAALPSFAISCGILFAFAAGGVLSAHALALVMVIAPMILLFSLLWLPETPPFLIRIGKMQEAAKVICWFEGSNFREDLTDVIEQQEVRIRTSECYGRHNTLRRQDSDTVQPMLNRSNGLDQNTDKRIERTACKELLCGTRGARALSSLAVLAIASACSCAGVVNHYAVAVLRYSAHTLPSLNVSAYNISINDGTNARVIDINNRGAEVGAVACGLALLLGAAAAVVVVDRIGRKVLLLSSCSGISFCLMVLGAYCDPEFSWNHSGLEPQTNVIRIEQLSLMQNTTFNIYQNVTVMETGMFGSNTGNGNEEGTLWAPIVLLSTMMFMYNVGLGSVPYVLVSEMFSIEVRGTAASVSTALWWMAQFVVLRYVGRVASALGIHAIYYIGAAVSLLVAIYTLLLLPETKGKTREQIDEELDGPLVMLKKNKEEQ